jgi:anti-sigma regulatory factor (Ser/Thr protein kinase)
MKGGSMAVATLPAEPHAVPDARRFAGNAVERLGGADETIDVARLLVTELATNAVVHARSSIRLSVIPAGGAVRIEIRDDDPRPLPQPAMPDPESTEGRGLWLVSALASSWGVNRNDRGKTVWFQVDVNSTTH